MRVIGAGFGRCGTTSTQAALAQLGFSPCYHMQTLIPGVGMPYKRPDQIPMWSDAAAGKPIDWRKEMEGIEATVDWPGAAFYKELMAAFPEARVVLNTRQPEGWYESTFQSIYQARTRGGGPSPAFAQMLEAVIWQGTFKGRFEDKAYAIGEYHRHYDEVRKHVPAGRLLEFDVRQGWEPLCRFLEVPVPKDSPFPRLNDRAGFQGRARGGPPPHAAAPERKPQS